MSRSIILSKIVLTYPSQEVIFKRKTILLSNANLGWN